MNATTTDRASTGRLTNEERALRLQAAAKLIAEVAADMNRERLEPCPCCRSQGRFAHYGEFTFARDLDGTVEKVERYAERARSGLAKDFVEKQARDRDRDR